MTGKNRIFSLTDNTTRYLKACGKRSILETKPLKYNVNIRRALFYAPNIQNIKFKVFRQQLDKNSYACKFFGVDSPENIIKSLKNQERLNKANRHWRTNNGHSGKIINLGTVSLRNFEDEKEFLHKNRGVGLCGQPWSLIDELKTQGAAKITFVDKRFGKNPSGGMHTVALVSKNNYLYVIDSLGEPIPEIKDFHSKVRELFSDSGFKEIIFSSKIQQPLDEFTCNNWAFANIKTVVSEIYGRDKKIKTTDELNKILRDDINNILKEQYNESIWY